MKTTTAAAVERLTIAVEIDEFLTGESDGEPVLQLLYGAPANEPVPQRLLATIRDHCPKAASEPVQPKLRLVVG